MTKIAKNPVPVILLLLIPALIGGLVSMATLSESDLTSDSLLECIEEQTCTVYVRYLDESFFTRYIYGDEGNIAYYSRAMREAPLALQKRNIAAERSLEAKSQVLIVYETFHYSFLSQFSILKIDRCEVLCLWEYSNVRGYFGTLLELKVP